MGAKRKCWFTFNLDFLKRNYRYKKLFFHELVCINIYIHACRTLHIYEFDVKMNLFSTIYNYYLYFGSTLFKVRNSGSDESQVKLESLNIGINDILNPDAKSKVKSDKWNHIYIRVSTGI